MWIRGGGQTLIHKMWIKNMFVFFNPSLMCYNINGNGVWVTSYGLPKFFSDKSPEGCSHFSRDVLTPILFVGHRQRRNKFHVL